MRCSTRSGDPFLEPGCWVPQLTIVTDPVSEDLSKGVLIITVILNSSLTSSKPRGVRKRHQLDGDGQNPAVTAHGPTLVVEVTASRTRQSPDGHLPSFPDAALRRRRDATGGDHLRMRWRNWIKKDIALAHLSPAT